MLRRELPALALALAACAGSEKAGGDGAASAINADSLMATVRVLSSDEFEGRAPGTAGEEKTVAYLTERFKALGLLPGNPDGSWVEKVVMVKIARAEIRRQPDENAPIVIQADQDVLLEVLDTVDNWAHVKHADGAVGYVRITQVWGL